MSANEPGAHGVHGSSPVALKDPAGQTWPSEGAGRTATAALAIKSNEKWRR
jgi:hypothetical protein